MPTDDLERRVAEALNRPCGCTTTTTSAAMGKAERHKRQRYLYECPVCRDKRIAAALRATEGAARSDGVRPGEAVRAGLAALEGES